MHISRLIKCCAALLMLAGCAQPLSLPLIAHTVRVTEHPPCDWTVNAQRLKELGCSQDLQALCPQLAALGCDAITTPGFYLGGLQPPYPLVECIHTSGTPPDKDHFRQPGGLDQSYRSFAVFQNGTYRLIIKKSEFRELFAPVESADEAISYATAMTSLEARYDFDPSAPVEYLVKVLEETHAEETPDGYLVLLFDISGGKMGCGPHTAFAVKVLVTPDGDVRQVSRQAIYKHQSCFDFGALKLED
ncbi:MAG: hypothetical protein HPY45_17625 [Anaerolineae bacterium]|nr:hypothetical protein [Anaerolineae bacterium]